MSYSSDAALERVLEKDGRYKRRSTDDSKAEYEAARARIMSGLREAMRGRDGVLEVVDMGVEGAGICVKKQLSSDRSSEIVNAARKAGWKLWWWYRRDLYDSDMLYFFRSGIPSKNAEQDELETVATRKPVFDGAVWTDPAEPGQDGV